MLQNVDKREYHRNYYYKRDPEKLNKYRKKYLKKKYNRVKNSVQRAEKYFRTHGRFENKEKEDMVLEFRKPKIYKSKYYLRNKEKYNTYNVAKYREKKLKEFTDNVLNIPDDNN